MNILITGANGGFGKLIAAGLLSAGHRVAGTMRDPGGRNAEAASDLRAMGAHVLEIDVTDQASVDAGVAAADAALGGIDALVNNAGRGVHGLQESFLADDFQQVFDINVFGVQRMMRAVLPAMRARGSGLIVNISSLLGRITMPFYGPYNASKWALEAMSETYRAELSQLGVDVTLVEPGGFPTEFHDSLMHPSDRDRDLGYGEMAKAPDAARQNFADVLAANPQQDPALVAQAVVAVVDTAPGARPFRTAVDEIGMRDLVTALNEQHHAAMTTLFTNFGMADLMSVKSADHEPA